MQNKTAYKTLYRDEFTGARTDKYEIKINDSKTITMQNYKYSACDAVKISLSQFNLDHDIHYDTGNNLSININEPEKTSWIITMISLMVDIGEHVRFKQDDKIVTLKRVFKTWVLRGGNNKLICKLIYKLKELEQW